MATTAEVLSSVQFRGDPVELALHSGETVTGHIDHLDRVRGTAQMNGRSVLVDEIAEIRLATLGVNSPVRLARS